MPSGFLSIFLQQPRLLKQNFPDYSSVLSIHIRQNSFSPIARFQTLTHLLIISQFSSMHFSTHIQLSECKLQLLSVTALKIQFDHGTKMSYWSVQTFDNLRLPRNACSHQWKSWKACRTAWATVSIINMNLLFNCWKLLVHPGKPQTNTVQRVEVSKLWHSCFIPILYISGNITLLKEETKSLYFRYCQLQTLNSDASLKVAFISLSYMLKFES